MTTPTDITKQLLPKPPRPLQDGTGYDWREFDRWMQRIHALLGVQQSEQTFNIPASIQQNFTEQLDLDFVTDHGLEIQLLRRMVEQLSTEVSMVTDQQQAVANLGHKIDDLYVEMGVS